MGSCSFCTSQEILPYYYNGTSTVLLEDQLYHRKTNCCVGRSTVLLEIDCIIGRSIVMLEDEWKIKGIIRKSAVLKTINWIRWKLPIKKITARRWLHKYVGAECGASSFTWYLYQMCNTDVRLWTESCPLCIFNNTRRIHFIFAHLIKQLQKVCCVYSLFQNLQNFEILANSFNL